MQIASSFSTSPETKIAIKNAYSNLEKQLGGQPSWMAVHCTDRHSGQIITSTLQEIAPDVPFQGGTSCLGIMTETGFHSDDGVSLGLFGIRDPEGFYSVGWAEGSGKSRLIGYKAIRNALQGAKEDISPTLTWLTCAPGDEENIISGIEERLGWLNTPIIGGSSADNTIEGNWYQITNNQTLTNGCVVTVMYPSRPIRYAFDNAYSPTSRQGLITKASERTIFEIDGRPAVEVYNEWTNGLIDQHLHGGNILSPSTMHPLGRVALWSRGSTVYQLSHPEFVLENGALRLFTNVALGERIVLMESSAENLVKSVNRITTKALSGLSNPSNQVAGALIIYCAGCMMAVKDKMDTVAEQFHTEIGEKPFLGLHTFGEQGCALLGENTHANLMMSIIVFEK